MNQIVKKFNNLLKKTIFKVKNKTNHNFEISNFNKYLITIVSLLFFYLFYLLIPSFYEKTWVQANIESKLVNEFSINLSTPGDISYQILPKPHFLIKDSKISVGDLEENKSIAEIKDLRIFISQNNFFNKEKMKIEEIKLNNVNFSLLRDNIISLNNASSNKFSDKKIEINNSNIFFKYNLGETITIIKIYKCLIFFDNEKLVNSFNLKGEVFNMPITINIKNKVNLTKSKEININVEDLRLNIFNKSSKTNQEFVIGKNIISFLNSRVNSNYDISKKLVTFTSDNSRINNAQVTYRGKLSLNPFDLDLGINLDDYRISKLFNINPILIEFIKSGLLFNENISLNTSIAANSSIKDDIFQNAQINFHIVNGRIDFDNTKFINHKIGSLILENSNLFFKNKNLILNTDLLIDIKSSDQLFSFLNTNKLLRSDIKKIFINLDYNLLTNQIKFNNIEIDNKEFNNRLLRIIEGFEDNNLNNLNKSRRLINELLKVYAG